jgi:hypothetical protein
MDIFEPPLAISVAIGDHHDTLERKAGCQVWQTQSRVSGLANGHF